MFGEATFGLSLYVTWLVAQRKTFRLELNYKNVSFSCAQGMSSKVAELEEELARANSDLEKEKATSLAQIEEIEALKKVRN